VIEESVMLGEVMLKLSDTAGIRETKDIVEQFGVDIAKKKIDTAMLVLAVFDSSSDISQEDKDIVESLKDKLSIAIINKTDLDSKIDMNFIESHFKNIVSISAKNATDIKLLEDIITKELRLNEVDTSAGMIANERQRECALRASRYVKESIEAVEFGMTLDAVTVSIEMAIDALLELTGDRITTEIVNQVFSHFCVGK